MTDETPVERFRSVLNDAVSVPRVGKLPKSVSDGLKEAVAALGGVGPREVHCQIAKGNSLYNVFFQGDSGKKRFAVGLIAHGSFAARREDGLKLATDMIRGVPADPPPPVVAVIDDGEIDKIYYSGVNPGPVVGRGMAALPDINWVAAKQGHQSLPPLPFTGVDPGSAPDELLPKVLRNLEHGKNVILQGPPGTGKTRVALQVIDRILEEMGGTGPREDYQLSRLADVAAAEKAPLVWEMIQLHPGYSYDDFVRGTVVPPGEQLAFEGRDGIFLTLCNLARARHPRPTLLILDEVNRCNLSAVLGEVILAIEASKRGRVAVSIQRSPPPGSKQRSLSVPNNLFVLGTMNTADRSISHIDFAIRRRFRMISVDASVEPVRAHYGEHDAARATKAAALFSAVNQLVVRREVKVGHGFFLVDPTGSDAEWSQALTDRIIWEVFPLLREYRRAGHLQVATVSIPGGPSLSIDGGADVRTTLANWLIEERADEE